MGACGPQKEGAVSSNAAHQTDPKSIPVSQTEALGTWLWRAGGLQPDYSGVMERQQVETTLSRSLSEKGRVGGKLGDDKVKRG